MHKVIITPLRTSSLHRQILAAPLQKHAHGEHYMPLTSVTIHVRITVHYTYLYVCNYEYECES